MSTFQSRRTNPSNPNRLNAGVTSVADKDKLPLLKRDSRLKRGLKIAALITSLLSGGIVAAGAAGVPLPTPLVTAAKVLIEVAKQATSTSEDPDAP